MASLSLTCLFAAAAAYHLSAGGLHALQAIRTVEGGHERPGSVRKFRRQLWISDPSRSMTRRG